MLLAKVIGNVVATQKNQRYEGSRIMLCRQITPEGDEMENTQASFPFKRDSTPTDCTIIGIVDSDSHVFNNG